MSEKTKFQKYKDKIDLLEKEAEKDLDIDTSHLEEYFNRQQLCIKWSKIYNNWKQMKVLMDQKVNACYVELYEKYTKKSLYELKAKEVAMFINVDTNYKSIKEESEMINIALDFIQSVIKSINGQAFEIKEYSEWKRFIKGVN